jgi:hypothetical protein
MNFIDSLNEMKRRSQLANQPFTPQEIMGMSSGFFDAAANNSGKVREQKLAEDRLAAEKEFTDNQIEAAKKAEATQMYQNVGNTAVTGLGMDYMSSKPGESLIAKGAGEFGDLASKGIESAFGNMVPDMSSTVDPSLASVGEGGVLATGGEAIGGTIGGLAEMAGVEGGMSAGSAIGSAAGSYLGPAGIGFAAPGVLNTIHKDSTENLGHNLSLGLIKDEGAAGFVGSVGAGAAAGAAAGSFIPVVGTAIGGVVGGVAGGIADLVKDACIIVTACTNRNSPEVEIARKFRNKYLSYAHLRGYYLLADKIVPILERNETARKNVKKWLVDRLIEYGKYRLGIYAKASISSIIVSKIFLATIKTIGVFVHRYVRLNGEVY